MTEAPPLSLSPEDWKPLFASRSVPPQERTRTVIVGGGLAGMLLALRLSRGAQGAGDGILLAEANGSLGGRLFFSIPAQVGGMTPFERFLMHWKGANRSSLQSGFGNEVLSESAAEAIERHIRSSLDEEEQTFLDLFTSHQNEPENLRTNCFFIKKQLTRFEELTIGPSELFTRKEAEVFAALLKADLPEPPSPIKWGESPFWKELPNAQKDAFLPLLESLVCRSVTDLPYADVKDWLRTFYKTCRTKANPLLLRGAGLELACELILRKRGVDVRTACSVARVTQEPQKDFRVVFRDDICPETKDTLASQVVIATPLVKSLTFLSRDFLSSSQAKWVQKMLPLSLVSAEYRDFAALRSPELPDALGPGSRLVFPAERLQGLVTSQNVLLLFSHLEYEDSLQAPPVRETLSRIRKAAARIFLPEALKGVSGQTLVTKSESLRERVVLSPVARYIAPSSAEIKDVKMGLPGLFCCGDGFTYEREPWKNVVMSVQDVATYLSR